MYIYMQLFISSENEKPVKMTICMNNNCYQKLSLFNSVILILVLVVVSLEIFSKHNFQSTQLYVKVGDCY